MPKPNNQQNYQISPKMLNNTEKYPKFQNHKCQKSQKRPKLWENAKKTLNMPKINKNAKKISRNTKITENAKYH